MAKLYYATEYAVVTKSFFGPWKIHYHERGRSISVPPIISNRFSDVVRIAKQIGMDVKLDPYAIGAVFEWLIEASDPDFGPIYRQAIASLPDENVVNEVRDNYQRLRDQKNPGTLL